ncbi:MAG: flavodoxin [Sphaerochaetaceae bacterium]
MKEKILITYFSHSGNTKRIAELIKTLTGGELLQIEPVQPYPRNYNTVVALAKKEISAGYLPEIRTIQEPIDSYDTIFIGSPNWWSSIAPPVSTFCKTFNFTEKKIIPFCTHGGGGEGHLFSDIRNACNNPKMARGLSFYGNGGARAENLLTDWLDELGIATR